MTKWCGRGRWRSGAWRCWGRMASRCGGSGGLSDEGQGQEGRRGGTHSRVHPDHAGRECAVRCQRESTRRQPGDLPPTWDRVPHSQVLPDGQGRLRAGDGTADAWGDEGQGAGEEGGVMTIRDKVMAVYPRARLASRVKDGETLFAIVIPTMGEKTGRGDKAMSSWTTTEAAAWASALKRLETRSTR